MEMNDWMRREKGSRAKREREDEKEKEEEVLVEEKKMHQ